jgi:hypothetical protein
MEECESKGIALDVNLMPPDDDDLTDEDSDEDEDSLPKDLNHLGRGILTQDAEIVEYDTEDTMPDLTRVSLFSVFFTISGRFITTAYGELITIILPNFLLESLLPHFFVV